MINHGLTVSDYRRIHAERQAKKREGFIYEWKQKFLGNPPGIPQDDFMPQNHLITITNINTDIINYD